MTTHALLLAPVVVPLLGAACFLLAALRPRRWLAAHRLGVARLRGALPGAAIGWRSSRSGHGPVTALGGLVRADSLSEFMLIVIGAVGLLATAASPAWLNAEIAAGRASAADGDPGTAALVQLFLAAMAAAVLAASLGLVWVAIEATTIVTAFLVGQRKTRPAVEAAWKYVMICSTGIALALLGPPAAQRRRRARRPPRRPGLDAPDRRRAAPRPGRHPDRRRAAAHRVRHQGRPCPAARLAARRARPGARAGLRAHVRRAAVGRLLRDPAGQGHRRRSRSAPDFARTLLVDPGARLAAARRVAADRAARLQADARLLLASSTWACSPSARPSAARSRSPRCCCTCSATAWPRASLFISAGRVLQLTGTNRIDEVRGLAGRAPLLAGLPAVSASSRCSASRRSPCSPASSASLGPASPPASAGSPPLALALVLVIAAMLLDAHQPHAAGSRHRPRRKGNSRLRAAPLPPEPSAPVPRPGSRTGAWRLLPVTLSARRRRAVRTARTLRGHGLLPVVAALAACAVLGVYAGPLTTLLHAAAQAAATP